MQFDPLCLLGVRWPAYNCAVTSLLQSATSLTSLDLGEAVYCPNDDESEDSDSDPDDFQGETRWLSDDTVEAALTSGACVPACACLLRLVMTAVLTCFRCAAADAPPAQRSGRPRAAARPLDAARGVVH